MCGIGGIVGGGPPDRHALEQMAAAMAHRGPDGQEVWHDENAGLAFRRLAIIDLDERSMQPLHLGPWHLAFNGEIYDYPEVREELRALGHEFVTEGDGEVLLHAWAEWEEDALNRIDGMFAAAIWNDERRELVVASDPFGEKPVYWAQPGERLAFASDITALMEVLPELGGPDHDALAPFLGRGLMPPVEHSFFAGVRRIPGAHLLRVREGLARIERYWQPGRAEVPAEYPEAVELLRELLTGSVRRRLRSDVPVGTSLSGGVDSSAVASLAADIAPGATRHAFTARFPGFERDEWGFAQLVAERAGVTEHHAVEPSGDGVLDELDQLVRAHQEPFGSLSIYAQWCVMRAARESGVTVLLDGQGADELFGGYPGSNGWALRSEGVGGVVRGLARSRDRRDVVLALGSDLMPTVVARRHRRGQVTPYASREVAVAAADVAPAAPPADGPLRRELERQAFRTSMPALLRYADRNSMAHSREVRLPFLDRQVAELALSMPPSFLYRQGVRKAVLRDAVSDLAPAEVMQRRDKVGYETPQASWLNQRAWVDRVADVLLDPGARARGLYVPELVEQDARAGAWRDPWGIWRLVNLELWLRAFERAPSAA